MRVGALRLRRERVQHRGAERLVVLEQRRVALLLGERPVGIDRADASRAQEAVEAGVERADLARVEALAGERRGGLAEERRRQLGARARLGRAAGREQEPLARGADGERELERLLVRPASAQRQRQAARLVEPDALVVEQERILARGRRKRALGQAEHRDGAEAQMAERVDVEHAHAAKPERALVAAVEIAGLERADLGAHRVEEARVVDRAGELVELRELVEVPEHLLGVLDDVLDEPPERRQALRPGALLGVRCEQPREVLDEAEQALGLDHSLGKPLGSALACRALALARDQRGEARAPLVEPFGDAGAARRRLPARDRDAAVALARLLGQPAVREEAQHVPAAQRRIDQVDQREDPAAERSLRDRRAIVEVDRDAGLGEHRLHDGPVGARVAVGDRHLAEEDPVARPVEAGARRLAHLGERVRSRDELHRVVRLGRRCRCEQRGLQVRERGRARLVPTSAVSMLAPALMSHSRSSRWASSGSPPTVGRNTVTGMRSARRSSSRRPCAPTRQTP